MLLKNLKYGTGSNDQTMVDSAKVTTGILIRVTLHLNFLGHVLIFVLKCVSRKVHKKLTFPVNIHIQ